MDHCVIEHTLYITLYYLKIGGKGILQSVAVVAVPLAGVVL